MIHLLPSASQELAPPNAKPPAIDLKFWRQQSLVLTPRANEILYGGAAAGGKGAVLPTACNAAKMGYSGGMQNAEFLKSIRHDVLTPFGFKPLSEIKVGDAVINPDGTTTRVIALRDSFNQDAYRVTFGDGTSVVVDGPHLWSVKVSGQRTRRKVPNGFTISDNDEGPKRFNLELHARYQTVTTKQLAELVGRAEKDDESGTRPRRICVPLPEPLNFQRPPGRMKMAPFYALGIWLGDGSVAHNSPSWSKPSKEIAEMMESELRKIGDGVTSRAGEGHYGITGQNFAECLRSAGLIRKLSFEKFIPAPYIYGEINDRWKLLQGLMDSDGTASVDGKTYFCTTSPRLRDDFMELARGLGFYTSFTVKEEPHFTYNGETRTGREAYIVYLTGRNRHKLFLCHADKKSRSAEINTEGGKSVVSVEKIGEGLETRCITVAHPNSLYVTNDYTVTHNSHAIRASMIYFCMLIPGLFCALFRRTFPELVRNHLEGPGSFRVLLAPLVNAGYARIVKREIRFWNGSKIVLSHLLREETKYDWQGAEIHFAGFDELTHFTEQTYRYIRARCRLGEQKIPDEFQGMFPRILCGANPGGIGHVWVKRTFVSLGEYNIVDFDGYDADSDDDDEGGMRRTYIPAKLKDNPSMLENDPKYAKRLMGLGDKILVRAMLDGDWSIATGAMFGDVWRDHTHVCNPFAIPVDWKIWRGGDDGYGSPASVVWITEDPDTGTFYVIQQLYRAGMLPNEMAERTMKGDREIPLMLPDGSEEMNSQALGGIMDSAAFGDTGQQNAIPRGNVMNKLGCKWKPAAKWQGSRVARCQHLHRLLATNPKTPGKPFLRIFRTCTNLIETIPTLPRDKNNPEDVDTDADDHGYDALSYGLQWKGKAFQKMQVMGA